jgi:hypothetical protein
MTLTATTPQDLYTLATSGNPVLNDPLTSPDTNNWDTLTYDLVGSCGFIGGTYHAIMPQTGYVSLCLAQATNFHNFAFQIQMTFIKGAAADGAELFFVAMTLVSIVSVSV